MAELVVEDLRLRFGGLVVLDRITLAVERQELLALIGPNGAGKTSVLNCISGIYRGDGRSASADATSAALRRMRSRGWAWRALSSMANCFRR